MACNSPVRRWEGMSTAPRRENMVPLTAGLRPAAELFDGLPEEIDVWMSHGDQVTAVAEDFVALASTDTCPIAAVKHRQRPVYGLQFHPEVTHTPLGGMLLRNFLMSVCQCQGTWRLGDFAQETVEQIRHVVGDARVICGLSGGVDSSVTAALLYQAIGSHLSCILVDNGLLRKDEKAAVICRIHQTLQNRFACGPGRGPIPERTCRGSQSPRKNADVLGIVLSIALPQKPLKFKMPASWPKARSIPT